MGRQRDARRMSAVMAGARERGMVPNTEPLTDAHLDMLEEDFRGERGCFSGDGLALVAEVRKLRKTADAAERWRQCLMDCPRRKRHEYCEDCNEAWLEFRAALGSLFSELPSGEEKG